MSGTLFNTTTKPPKQGRKLNIAVAGLGRMGKRHVLTLATRVPRANIVAVCGVWSSELEWAHVAYKDTGIAVYDEYDKMLAHNGLDAVWVSSSTNVHAEQTLKAIDKGLHVLCEKPLSTDIEIATHVVEVAKKNPQLKVMAGYSRRFDKSYRTAKSNLDKTVGTPYITRSQTCDLIDETGFFVKYAKLNGGIFVDCAIHDIDLSLYYMGEDLVPKNCFAVGTNQHHPELDEMKDVDNGVGIVEYHGGKIGYFYCSRTQAHGHDVSTEVVGTEGKISINLVPKVDEVVYNTKGGVTHKVQPEYWERFEHAFALEANEFVDCVLDDKPCPVGLDIGLKGLKIGWALQESLWTGEAIKFDENFKRLTKEADPALRVGKAPLTS